MHCRTSHDVGMATDSTVWYRLSLGDGITSTTTLDAIKDEFELIGSDACAPAAVFKRLDAAHGLHCEVTVYFSPGTAQLATRFAAAICRRPTRTGLELLAGDARVLSTLIDDAT